MENEKQECEYCKGNHARYACDDYRRSIETPRLLRNDLRLRLDDIINLFLQSHGDNRNNLAIAKEVCEAKYQELARRHHSMQKYDKTYLTCGRCMKLLINCTCVK